MLSEAEMRAQAARYVPMFPPQVPSSYDLGKGPVVLISRLEARNLRQAARLREDAEAIL